MLSDDTCIERWSVLVDVRVLEADHVEDYSVSRAYLQRFLVYLEDG